MTEIKKILKNKDILTILAIIVLGLILFVFKPHSSLSQNLTSISSSSNSSLGTNSNEVLSIRNVCQGLTNKEQCYSKAFANLTKKTDMNHAFNVLRELQRTDFEARGCHLIAHSISSAETEKDPAKWREIMNNAPQDCSYGAAHGALEVHAASLPDGKIPVKEVLSICDNPDRNNCTHILGHLILVLKDNNIDSSLSLCDKLPHNENGKFECLTGVFMERITALNLEQHGLATKEALNWSARMPELEKLCREQTGIRSVACWKEIVHAALIKFNNNPQKIVDFCETAPGETETKECINHSLGILGGAYNFNLSKMRTICDVKVKDATFPNRCYASLVGATLSTVPQEVVSAVQFCGSISHEYQKDCFSMMGNSLYMAKPELKTALANACKSAPQEFINECSSGGNTSLKLSPAN